MAVERDEGDLIAIEDPNQAQRKHDEDVPRGEGKVVESAERLMVQLLIFSVFFGVDLHLIIGK